MTTTAGDLDLKNRLRLTFEDKGGAALPLRHLIGTLNVTYTLCEAASWLTAYYSGAALSPAYFRTAGAWTSYRRVIGDAYVDWDEQRVAVWPTSGSDVQPPEWAIPKVARLSKQSPMIIDLVFQAVPLAAGGSAAAVVIAALRNPKSIGAWFPSVAAGWHGARLEALRARVEREQLAQEHEDLRKMVQWELDYRNNGGSTYGIEYAEEQNVWSEVRGDLDNQTDTVTNAVRSLRDRGLIEVQGEHLEDEHPEE